MAATPFLLSSAIKLVLTMYLAHHSEFLSLVLLLLRQLLEAGMRSNFYFCFTINYEQAKAFRNANGQYLRQSQWEDITVEVIF